MQFVYEATTEMGKFMLDRDGICRAVEPVGLAWGSTKLQRKAERCIGAQYVASLDHEVRGGLVTQPQVGGPMLFAAIDATGRIFLIRTGPMLAFRTLDSGVRRGFDRALLPVVPRDPPTIRDVDEGTGEPELLVDTADVEVVDVDDGVKTAIRRAPVPPDSETSLFQRGPKPLRILPPVPYRRA